jgi:hypothetical protein
MAFAIAKWFFSVVLPADALVLGASMGQCSATLQAFFILYSIVMDVLKVFQGNVSVNIFLLLHNSRRNGVFFTPSCAMPCPADLHHALLGESFKLLDCARMGRGHVTSASPQ